MENYVNYAVEKTVELLAIDSPTGYTDAAEEYVRREFEALGFAASRTVKGGERRGGKSAPPSAC